MKYKFYSYGVSAIDPVDKKDRNEGILYCDYRDLRHTDFTILKDNEKVRLDVDVRLTITQSNRDDSWIDKNFTIKKGYIFDGASIPPMFWGLVGEPDDKDFIEAALIHDYLYERRYNREVADEIFRRYLISEGVWSFKARLMWLAVRLGGHVFYAGDTSKFWRKVRNLID